jgi:uncharacterized protein
MKRFVLQQLIEWKNREDRKPLILNGARQVGKTWLLHEFAKLEYKKEAYVVCRKNNLARQLFSQDFNVDRILRGLRAMTSVDITPGDTLIILDEIQDIPEALESLKYFKEEVPEYHIAVAGSLLGISLHQDVSYPVGKVNVINIFPMNFEEFLVAKGEEEACKLLMSGDFETISLLHDKYTDLLRQYYYVGGMPEELATASGVSPLTVANIEKGKSVSLLLFISVLRSLGLLENLEQLVPEIRVSPIELKKLQGKKRYRVRHLKQDNHE